MAESHHRTSQTAATVSLVWFATAGLALLAGAGFIAYKNPLVVTAHAVSDEGTPLRDVDITADATFLGLDVAFFPLSCATAEDGTCKLDIYGFPAVRVNLHAKHPENPEFYYSDMQASLAASKDFSFAWNIILYRAPKESAPEPLVSSEKTSVDLAKAVAEKEAAEKTAQESARAKDLSVDEKKQGRWILEDVTPLAQVADAEKTSAEGDHLFVFYVRSAGRPVADAEIWGEHGPNGVRQILCHSNSRGRCMFRGFETAGEKNAYVVRHSQYITQKITTAHSDHPIDIGLQPGKSITIRTVEKLPLAMEKACPSVHRQGLAGVELSVDGHSLGKSDAAGEFDVALGVESIQTLDVTSKAHQAGKKTARLAAQENLEIAFDLVDRKDFAGLKFSQLSAFGVDAVDHGKTDFDFTLRCNGKVFAGVRSSEAKEPADLVARLMRQLRSDSAHTDFATLVVESNMPAEPANGTSDEISAEPKKRRLAGAVVYTKTGEAVGYSNADGQIQALGKTTTAENLTVVAAGFDSIELSSKALSTSTTVKLSPKLRRLIVKSAVTAKVTLNKVELGETPLDIAFRSPLQKPLVLTIASLEAGFLPIQKIVQNDSADVFFDGQDSIAFAKDYLSPGNLKDAKSAVETAAEISVQHVQFLEVLDTAATLLTSLSPPAWHEAIKVYQRLDEYKQENEKAYTSHVNRGIVKLLYAEDLRGSQTTEEVNLLTASMTDLSTDLDGPIYTTRTQSRVQATAAFYKAYAGQRLWEIAKTTDSRVKAAALWKEYLSYLQNSTVSLTINEMERKKFAETALQRPFAPTPLLSSLSTVASSTPSQTEKKL